MLMRDQIAAMIWRAKEAGKAPPNNIELADALGSTTGSISVQRSRLRAAGRLPPGDAAPMLQPTTMLRVLRVISSARRMGVRVSDAVVAERLGIHVKTVSTHKYRLRKRGLLAPDADARPAA